MSGSIWMFSDQIDDSHFFFSENCIFIFVGTA